MASLYAIDAAILACVDLETGEIIDEAQLHALQMEREQKIENVALWYKNLLSDAAQYAAEEQAFKQKRLKAQAQAERAKAFLLDALQGSPYKSTRVNITHRSCPRVVVDDVLNLPPQFVRFAEPEPKKTEIMAAIKNGKEVNGAHIESGVSIIIK